MKVTAKFKTNVRRSPYYDVPPHGRTRQGGTYKVDKSEENRDGRWVRLVNGELSVGWVPWEHNQVENFRMVE